MHKALLMARFVLSNGLKSTKAEPVNQQLAMNLNSSTRLVFGKYRLLLGRSLPEGRSVSTLTEAPAGHRDAPGPDRGDGTIR